MTSSSCVDTPGRQVQHPVVPSGLVGLFAVAAGASVANVYYAQPLLDAVALDLGIPLAAVGGVITATQLGSALALLLLVPLGDRVNRRPLMAWQLLALVLALLAVAWAPSAPLLMGAMLAVGLLGTAMTQGLIAYAASVAPPDAQGRVVGGAQSGVFIGLLLARVLAGAVGDAWGWRSVYMASAALMLAMALPLWWWLPVLAHRPSTLGYRQLVASMGSLLRRDRVLQVRGVLALLMFAAFSIFWSSLVLPLRAAPFGFSHTAIGLFGLVGAAGALAATLAGRWVDRGQAQRASMWALLALLLAWLPLAGLGGLPDPRWAITALVLGIVLLDLGGQALHVSNQGLIFARSSDAHSRVVAVYMLFYAVGSGLGAISATSVYAYAGWLGVCALGAVVSGSALLFWRATCDWMRADPANAAANA
ncbi:MFS transporter [Comamonas sp.]|uniref:MFS transporter n=1 Tax=Comamonas sp. TaxID=34028 RepID=UPI003D0D0DB1